ncbi:hypothetical protein FC47_GL001827 [Limosilactobacillus mucosae DSM 13345]|uniref:Uncharacterized protein n=1 Tax=Limosilactobacillus mucosae DSM 13345 TaxID=1423771 RepID=A0A0R1NKQ5_LIMMU|nr:hypothetical protein FC47_GL001827 [Limosilactobacillus mucosae DSM 13345]
MVLLVWYWRVLTRISWCNRAWINWRVAWYFRNWFVWHDLRWIIRVRWVRWRVGTWNWIAIWINRNQFTIWCVGYRFFHVWIVRRCRQSTSSLLVGIVAINDWRIFRTECLGTFPITHGDDFTSYLVNRNSPREGVLLSLNLVSWRLVAGANVVNRLGGIFDQVVAVSIGWVNWTVRIIRIDWLARRYRIWIVRRDGLRLVLQVNHKVVASFFVDLTAISKVVGYQFVALIFVSLDLVGRGVVDR